MKRLADISVTVGIVLYFALMLSYAVFLIVASVDMYQWGQEYQKEQQQWEEQHND